MAVVLNPGQQVQRGDLCIHLQDSGGSPTDVPVISYAVYYVDPGPPETEVLIGSAARVPAHPQRGEYFASLFVPADAVTGRYRIRWTFQEAVGQPPNEVVEEFTVVSRDTRVVNHSAAVQELIRRLRIHIRDHNPDKFYHFRPPEHEGRIGGFNRVFGQIWEDQELYEYLRTALDEWNMAPPETESLCTIDALLASKPVWKPALIWGAIKWAAVALTLNWVADEFDYSIGGISLSIEKSSKYESIKQNAESQLEKMMEQKRQTTKYVRGLQQPRFGIGVRSAFGPHVGGRGTLSPRNFVG